MIGFVIPAHEDFVNISFLKLILVFVYFYIFFGVSAKHKKIFKIVRILSEHALELNVSLRSSSTKDIFENILVAEKAAEQEEGDETFFCVKISRHSVQ